MIKKNIYIIFIIINIFTINANQTADYLGKYTYNSKWKGKTGTGEIVVKGTIKCEVNIENKNGELEINGIIDFQPPSKILIFKSNLKYIKDKKYEFFFNDNWKNKSKGKVFFEENSLEIDLEIIKRSENGSKVGSLYGHYTLTKNTDVSINSSIKNMDVPFEKDVYLQYDKNFGGSKKKVDLEGKKSNWFFDLIKKLFGKKK